MAVPEGRRTETKLAVLTKAFKLADHTMTLCANEDVFPEDLGQCLANRILASAFTILEEIDAANDIYVRTKDDFILRRKSQTIALSATARMLRLMELAYIKFNIDGDRIRYWTQLVVDVRELLKPWRTSDLRRYKSLLG